MIYPHPTLIAFLARDRQDALLRQAEQHRLIREARATHKESRLRQSIARISLAWHTISIRSGLGTQPGPAEQEEGDDSSAAA